MIDEYSSRVFERRDVLVRSLPTLRSELSHLESKGLTLDLGELSYGRVKVMFSGDPGRKLRVGNFTSIGPDVKIFVGRQGIHPIDFLSVFPVGMLIPERSSIPRDGHSRLFDKNLDVEIGNDVWIGANSIILAGTTIGDGSVIAAGSVVNRDVEPYSVYGGVPAKFIKSRFDRAICDALISICWWDIPLDKLIESADMIFYNPDLNEVIENLIKIKTSLED